MSTEQSKNHDKHVNIDVAAAADDGDGGGGLQEDQVFEMLTRVSPEDLAVCRQVSGRWRRLTYEPAFTSLHCSRTDAVSGYFVQSMTHNRYSATFVSMHPSTSPPVSLAFLPSKHFRIEAVASHRGLMCCAADVSRKACYFVCKPSTKQWRALPNPRVRFRTAAAAMVARPFGATDFKIVRFSVPTLMDCLRCEIFDSRRWAWRRSADVKISPVSLCATGAAVRAHGAMHWLRWPDRHGQGADIFAFDVKNETWKLIGLPPSVTDQCRDRWVCKKIVAMEGKLCLVLVVEEEMEMWVMANYMQERWEKKEVVSLKNLTMQEGNAVILKDFYSSNVAFLDSFYSVMWYDFWRGKMAEVPVDHRSIQEVFKYESDLVPCKI